MILSALEKDFDFIIDGQIVSLIKMLHATFEFRKCDRVIILRLLIPHFLPSFCRPSSPHDLIESRDQTCKLFSMTLVNH